MLGLPAIAVSQQSRRARARLPLRRRLRLRRRGRRSWRGWWSASRTCRCRRGTLLNVNVPAGAPSGVEVTSLGKRIYRDELKLEREEEARAGATGSTAPTPASTTSRAPTWRRSRRGAIAVTPIHFDLTDRPSLEALRRFDLRGAARAGRRRDAARERRRRASRPTAGASRARRSCASSSSTTPTATTCSTTPRSATTPTTRCSTSCARSRREHPELRHARLAHPARRRRAGGPPGEGRAPRADALARQRALGGGAARVGRAHAQPPRARGDRRTRASSSWSSRRSTAWRSACLPRRRARARRHARQRRDRRGRHAQPAHDRRDPAAHRGRAAAAGGARRGLHVADGLHRAQRAPRRSGRVDVHEPAQLGGRHDPPARSRADAAERPLSMWCYQVGVAEGLSFETPLARRSSGCASTASASTATSRLLDERGRGDRAVPATGSSAAASSTSRSTASWSRSTTSSCSAGSARSGATRAGRSPGSSRRRPR